MHKIVFVISVLFLFASCAQKKEQTYGEVSDRCTLIDQTLIGIFSNPYQEGTMTFTGGLNGSVDIAGQDYNDIVCTYIITDCESNKMSMNCNGAPYESDLFVYTRDSIMVGMTTYTRVK